MTLLPLSRGLVVGRAVIDRETIHHADIVPLLDTEYPDAQLPQQKFGFRALLGVPLMREDRAIGAIALWRMEARRFTDRQIALVKTFAGQAAIAIENVRLFKELEERNRDLTEALEQQTATSDILRVISQSQTDVQPVFETIAAAAMKLCRASSANVFTFDGELIHLAAFASVNVYPEYSSAIRRNFPRPPSRDTAVTRAVLTGGVVVIPDVLEDPEYAITPQTLAGGFRSVLAVPLIREGSPIGAIVIGDAEPGPFPDTQIALLQTFADQAVIAIENVRLFKETKEALEQQTATSDILRVISQSQTDAQPVFDSIAKASLELCGAESANVFTFDGELVHLVSLVPLNSQYLEVLRQLFPRPPSRDTAVLRAIQTRSVVAIPDVLEDREYLIADSCDRGRLSQRPGRPADTRWKCDRRNRRWPRPNPGRFPKHRSRLLQTFADQAVIAIENVRLFKELEARTAQLTQSVGELRALGEVGQAVSSTLDLETVLSTIVSRATALAGMDGGAIYEYDEARGEFYLHTADRLPDELVTALRAGPIPKGEGALGRMAMTGEPAQIRDIMTDASYQSRLREIVLRLGYRSLMAVPLTAR